MPAKKAAAKKTVKKSAPNKAKSFEESLWQSANKLRGSVEPSEYKHVVLSLIFLKFASDKFTERREELVTQGKGEFVEMEPFYTMKNVFYLPEHSRWDFIKGQAKQDDFALKIDSALHTIERSNPALAGALPDNYFSRLDLDRSKLASLIDEVSNINTIADKSQDVVGRVYEYFLGKFALAEGKGKGEFYTPKSIVNLIAELIEPYRGVIYDPCCGSGGMFVQSVKFVENHQGNTKDISIYGQEGTSTTLKLGKMNLAIRGIAGNLGARADDTFHKDQHPDLKADFIMANPPFNQKDWRAADELTDDPRWAGYDVPPTGNANYAWILHMVSKLSENGVAGFILANGALSGDGQEKAIRKKLIDNRIVEAVVVLPMKMFYTTDISVSMWILNKNKKAHTENRGDISRDYRDRSGEVLFVDLRKWGEPFEKKFTQISENQRDEITRIFHTWQEKRAAKEYENIPEFCYSATAEEIAAKDFSLVPSKYVQFINRDENVNFHEKMTNLKAEFTELLKDETESKEGLLNVFKELGYEIEL